MQPNSPAIAGTVLRVPAVQSPNYVAGSVGWIIRADGSAEFNGVTMRGDLYIVGPGGSEIQGLIDVGLATLVLVPDPGFGTYNPAIVRADTGDASANGALDLYSPSKIGSPGDVAGISLGGYSALTGGATALIFAGNANGFVTLSAQTIQLITNGGLVTSDAPIYAIRPSTTVADTWNLATLLNGFTNSAPRLQYRLVASPAKSVHVVGLIASGATTGSGTTIATLPAGYRPASVTAPAPVVDATTGYGCWLGLDSSGNLSLHGVWANGNGIVINSLFPLDLS
jgi:hypothetical protein